MCDNLLFIILFYILFDGFNFFDLGQLFPIGQSDQTDTLGVASHLANVADRDAHQGATVGNQHDFIITAHLNRADNFAVAFIGLHGNHALTATTLDRVLGRRGAFAETVLGRCQDRAGQSVAFGVAPEA